MINIISKSIYSKEIRGPKKVVDNLIKGLDEIGYPYVINQRLDSTKRLWIHDDIRAFKQIDDLPSYVHVLAGPNLFLIPQEIPAGMKLPNTIYLQPSENIRKVWIAKGYDKSPTEIWASGVDLSDFNEKANKKNQVLIYFKQRKEEELDKVTGILKNLNIAFAVIKYGSYKESVYKEAVNNSKYIIWLGCFESQGIALLEALALNTPILVIDKEFESKWEGGISSAPYFSDQCGLKIKGLESLSEGVKIMEARWKSFNPRAYVEENFSPAGQAKKLLFLYEKYFNLTVKSGFNEKIIRAGKWRNDAFWYKTFVKIKDFIKLNLLFKS